MRWNGNFDVAVEVPASTAARHFKSLGLPMVSAPATRQVFQDVSSSYPFVRVAVSGNHG